MDKKKQHALQEAFNKADTNGDGQLDLEEFINHFKSQGLNRLNFTEILITNISKQRLMIKSKPTQKQYIILENLLKINSKIEILTFRNRKYYRIKFLL